jgi:redox-sensitive bicupin YhaK (pirin superfamily)
MTVATIVSVVQLPQRKLSEGLDIAHVHPESLGWDLDPVLQVDWFAMRQPFFPPHPHAGFSAVTYMLPDSKGGFINRDSSGDRSLIRPGALHWTEAASGIMHEEVPEHPGLQCDGLQIFMNLPAVYKDDEPRVYHVEPEAAPVVHQDGGVVRVLAGRLGDSAAAVSPRTDCLVWDIALEPHAHVQLPVDSKWRITGLVTAGELQGDPADAPAGTAVQLGVGEKILLRAGPMPTRVVLLGGRPLDEPIAVGGPFVMNTRAQILAAQARYQAGAMGRLERSF